MYWILILLTGIILGCFISQYIFNKFFLSYAEHYKLQEITDLVDKLRERKRLEREALEDQIRQHSQAEMAKFVKVITEGETIPLKPKRTKKNV